MIRMSRTVWPACGDVTDDPEMVECFCLLLSGVRGLRSYPNNTGDGVRADFLPYLAIKEPPFYAIKRVPSVLASVGGVQVNDDLRVLRDDNEPFNGLYACGDVAGSFYGHEYPLHLPGGSIGRGFVFGILSVKAMCGDLESTVE